MKSNRVLLRCIGEMATAHKVSMEGESGFEQVTLGPSRVPESN